jgi:PAS domain S-box-containing protein
MPPPEAQREITILHVDDEPEFLALTKAFLEREQERFVVDTATSVEEALKRLDERSYNVIVSDYQMPGLDGLTFLQQVRERSSTIPFIMFTGKGREEVAIEALNRGANHYLQKGTDIVSMYGTLIYAIEEVVSKNWALEALRASESEYRTIFETTGTATVIVEEDATLSLINTEFERLSGCSRAEIEGKKKWTEFVVHEDLARMSEYHRLRRNDPNAAPSTYEFRFVDAAGTVKDILLSINMIAGTKKSLASLLDISQRKKAELALREAEAKYAAVVENSLEGIVILQDGMLKFVNSIYSTLMGYTSDELLETNFLEMVAPEFRELTLEIYTDRLSGKEPPNIYEIALLHKDGSILPVEINATVISYEGKPADLVFIRTIADRKRSEEALRASEAKYRTMIEHTGTGICVVEEDTTISFVNQEFERITGYTKEEVEGNVSWTELIVEEDLAVMKQRHKLRREVGSKVPGVYEFRMKTKSGETKHILLNVDLIPGTRKSIASLIDITDRKRMEERIREESSFRNKVITKAAEGLCVCHEIPEYPFVAFTVWNDRMTEITGYTMDEINRLGWYQTMYPNPELQACAIERMARMRKGDDLVAEVWVITRADGEKRTLLISTSVLKSENSQTHVLAFMQDVTERKQIETGLKENERFLKDILDGIQDGISVLDCDLTVRRVNWWVEQKYADEMPLIGKKCFAVYQKRQSPCPWCPSLPTIKTGIAHTEVVPYPIADNPTGWIELSAYPLKDPDGCVTGIVEHVKDITARKNAEEALQANEKRYRELTDSLPQVVFEIDEAGTLTFVNRFAFELFGYSQEEFETGLNALQMIAPEDRARAHENIQRVLKGEPLGCIEYTAQRKNGTVFPVLIYSNQVIYGNRPVGLRGILVDLSERKRTEEVLRKSEERYRVLTDESPLGIAIVSPDGHYHYVNSKFVEIFGYTLEDVPTGRDWFIKAYPDEESQKEAITTWLNDLKTSKPGEFRPRSFTVTCKDGTQKLICFRSVTLSTGEQLVTYEDSTAQKRAEAECAAILKELSAKNRELERFTYTVSHDLRSPLVTIEGFADMLQKDLEQNNQKRVMSDLQYISTAATKMDELLSATLKLSRIGRMVNPPEDVPFGTLVQDALAQTAGEIQASGVELAVADQFPSVHVDRLRIAELLVNLISNSIKYRGDRPDPLVEIGHRMDGDETVFFVKDNGIGIDKSEQEKVFEIFYQVDRRSGGTGAGLAIVRRIVEMHGGRIWLESAVGKGCTVCFTLPVVDESRPVGLALFSLH